jgi:sarcosine oxidase subunit beta
MMVAAQAHGARFHFRTEVTSIGTTAGRVGAIGLADGTSVRARVVVNAAGPYSSRVNEMAGVLGHQPITTRALRQEVHAVPAPPTFAIGDGAPVVGDADLGTYFRPQVGGTVLVGGVEPECDPLVWIDDPDRYDELPSLAVWEAQTLRLARRLPELGLPGRPVGLAALYDVTPDWVPTYDRSSLDGYYQAIGTSGNQFKNAPTMGIVMATLIEACEQGHDHDRDPVVVHGPVTGQPIDIGHFSRLRTPLSTSNSVMG